MDVVCVALGLGLGIYPLLVLFDLMRFFFVNACTWTLYL